MTKWMWMMTESTQHRWRWVIPGKTIVWADVRGKMRLCRIEEVLEWTDNGRGEIVPLTVALSDVNALLRGEEYVPYPRNFRHCYRLHKPRLD